MSAIDAVVEPPDDSAHRGLREALEDIATATSFYDFEDAWISGLRMVPASDGEDARDRVLATAGRRLSSLGEFQDDVARRSWLHQIAEEVQLRGDNRLGADLEAVAAAELREAFARAAGDLPNCGNRSQRAGASTNSRLGALAQQTESVISDA